MAIELDKLSITAEDVKAEALKVIPVPFSTCVPDPRCATQGCENYVESSEDYCTDCLDKGLNHV